MIIRAKHDGKTAPYVIISRKLIQDNQLPYGPKCLLLLMLSYPDTWNFTEKMLATAMAEPETTIRTWLDTLNKLGYFYEDADIEFGETRIRVNWLVTEEPSSEAKHD